MDNPRLDDAGDQPESVNPVPDPSIDITRTTPWISVHNRALLDVGTAVTHHNMKAVRLSLLGLDLLLIISARRSHPGIPENASRRRKADQVCL